MSGGLSWLIVSSYHVCDDTPGEYAWIVVVLPAAAGVLFSLRPYSAVVCVAACIAASMTVATVVIMETLNDGSISPSGSQCEPAPGGMVMLVPITAVILTVLLLAFHVLGIGRQRESS
jgi:hypothetical protein